MTLTPFYVADKSRSSMAYRYGLALLCALAAVSLRWVLDSLLGDYVPLAFAYGFVALTVWQAGWGPALFTAITSYLAMKWLFIEPRHAFSLSEADFWSLMAHAMSVLAIVMTGDAMRRGREQAQDYAAQLKDEQTRINEQARLLDLSHDAIIVRDPDGRIRYWNHGAQAMYGWTHEEAVGRISHDLLKTEFPIPLADIEAELERTTQWRGELVHRCKDGHAITVLTRWALDRNAKGLPHSILETNTDITARKRAEEQLQESEERLRLFIENAPAGIAMFDRDMRYMAVSRRWVDDYGLSEDIIGKTHYDVFPDIPEHWKEIHRRGLAGEVLHSDGDPFVRSDGTVQWVRWDVRPWRTTGQQIGGIIIAAEEITGRKQADEALRRSESTAREHLRELQTIYDTSPIGMCLLDRDLRYVRINAPLAKMNGIPAGDHIGKTVREIVPLLADGAEPIFRRILETGESVIGQEVTGETKADPGVPHVWIESLVPQRDDHGQIIGLNVAVQDVTSMKRTEQALREQGQRLRLAMEGAHMGAWEFDPRTGSLVWDARQHELFGLPLNNSPKSIDDFWTLLHPDDVAQAKQAVAASELTGRLSIEFRVVHPHGIVRWIAAEGAMVGDEEGRPIRMLGVNYDITDQKVARTKLEQFAEELERRVTARTRELMESQDRLRTLATELSIAEQRERKRLATELHDHLQQLLVLGKLKLAQGKRLAQNQSDSPESVRQVDDILSEALQYTRTLVADLSPPVLRDHGLLAGLIWLADYMKKHDLTVALNLPKQTELRLPEEQMVLVFQTVRELLVNASKHAGIGYATVTLEQHDDQLRIEVQDEGVGFDPAVAAAGDAHNKGLSSKFWLFSVQERMKALGGTFEIASAIGQGTSMVLTLPLDITAPSNVPSQHSPARTIHDQRVSLTHTTQQGAPLARLRVLLVDDHAMMREGLRTVLDGYADIDIVGEASNGEEAVAAVERLHPKLVIMDINMPKKNGIEATAEIKGRFPDIGIIGLSVNADADNERAMRKAGAAMLLTKEAAVDHLYAAIQEMASLKPTAAAESPASYT